MIDLRAFLGHTLSNLNSILSLIILFNLFLFNVYCCRSFYFLPFLGLLSRLLIIIERKLNILFLFFLLLLNMSDSWFVIDCHCSHWLGLDLLSFLLFLQLLWLTLSLWIFFLLLLILVLRSSFFFLLLLVLFIILFLLLLLLNLSLTFFIGAWLSRLEFLNHMKIVRWAMNKLLTLTGLMRTMRLSCSLRNWAR